MERRQRDLPARGARARARVHRRDDVLIDAITEHIESYYDGFGEDAIVLHEVISELVHIDVHVVKPTDERPYYTLITSGMAERPMTVPEGLKRITGTPS